MAPPTVAFFVMAEDGHVRRLLPLVAAVAARGVRARVWTHRRFAKDVAQVGGEFGDLFAGRSLESADSESMPVPCRFVTFAGVHGEGVLADVERDRPSLVVHDSFAVVGRAIAGRLGLPCVHACAGHAVDPRRFLPILARDPRVRVSDRCRAAADSLRANWAMTDASPFAYVSPPSPDLNVYGEPPEWLTEAERAAFEPIAFFGCLPDEAPAPEARPARAGTRLFASFGTVVQRYYAEEALAALEAVAGAVARRPEMKAVLGVGGATDAAARLTKDNVTVLPFPEQRRSLSEADVFVTHHGLNSTHEAIWHGVPMLSYPFFWDQPALAQRCEQFGVSVPLVSAPRAPLTEARVGEALDALLARRDSIQDRLAEARSWELRVMAGRAGVVDRMLGLLLR